MHVGKVDARRCRMADDNFDLTELIQEQFLLLDVQMIGLLDDQPEAVDQVPYGDLRRIERDLNEAKADGVTLLIPSKGIAVGISSSGG